MRFIRPLAVALTAVGLATCADAPSSLKDSGPRPGGQFAARVAVGGQVDSEAAQTMAALAAVNVAVNNVRVVLVRPPSDTLKDTVVNVTPGQTSLTLDLTVNINGMEETLTAEIQLRDGSNVLFSGTQSIVVRALISGLPPASNPPITLDYVGPGSNVARIDVLPPTATLAPGATQQYTAVGVDASGAPVPDLIVAWSTTDGTIATIDPTTGLLTAGQVRGTTTVRATSPSLVAGEATVSVTLPAAAIELVSGNAQSAAVGSALPQPLVVRVRASDNVPVQGATVTFAVLSGGGSLSATEVATDADGLAEVTATLGSAPGENSFSASVAGVEAGVTFTATATPGSAASIAIVGGNGQSGAVGSTLSAPLVVKVADSFGNAVPGATVSFASVTGGGTVSAPEVTTNAEGLAQVNATLGTVPGENTFSASIAGNQSVTFTATATPGTVASIAIRAGDGQTAAPGTAVPVAPSVLVADAFGNPVPGAPVVFVPSGGGSVTGAETLSDADGVATVGSWTLGTSGEQRLSATSGAHSVEFVANSVAPRLTTEPEDLMVVTVTAGEVPSAVIFRVFDHLGVPIPGLPLALEIPDGETTGTTVIETDAEGRVTGEMIVAVLGGNPEAAGSYPITASGSFNGVALTGSPRTITLVVEPAAAAAVTLHEGGGQSAAPGQPVPIAPAVLVTDAYGNVIPGAAVTFSVISGGGSVTGAEAVTGTDGIARVGSWTLGSSGEQRLRATHGSLSVDITAISTAGGIYASLHLGPEGPASLYFLDRTNGSAQLIGPIGFNRVGAMDFSPLDGQLYGTGQRPGSNTPVLLRIDPATGAGTEIGPTGAPGAVSDMSFRSDGTLFMFVATPGDHRLYTVNTSTGAATLVGQTNQFGGGNALTFNAADQLFHSGAEINRISMTTGAATRVADLQLGGGCTGGVLAAADFDRTSGTWFAVAKCGGESFADQLLLQVDFTTGALAPVGTIAGGFDGLAVLNPPGSEPAVAPAVQLAFSVQPPATVSEGESFSVTVVARDAGGNVVPSFDGPVTLQLSTNPSGATLGGEVTLHAFDGVAVFEGLSIDRAGTGYVLEASTTNTAVASQNSAGFNVIVEFGGIYGVAGGSGSGTPATLYKLDRQTGQAASIGPIGFDRVGAMDFHPTTGVLYAAAVRISDGTRVLITIDPATGAGTEVGPMGLSSGVSDMSFRSDGSLYVMAFQNADEAWGLFLVDLATGATDPLGNAGWNGGGNSLAFDAAGVLFHSDHNYASSISVIDGSTLYLADVTIPTDCFGRAAAADLDRITGKFFAAIMCGEGNASYLAELDHRSGAASIIGETVARMDAIAVRNAPGSEAPTQAAISLVPAGAVTMTAGEGVQSALTTVLTSAASERMPGVGLRFSYENQEGQVIWMTLVHTNGEGEVNTAAVLNGMAELLHVAGTHVVRVSTEAVPVGNAPFEITVNVLAGPAAAIDKVAGDAQEGAAGQQLPINPSVHVTDSFGNNVPGVTVTFSVTSGGGSVTGGSALTDANGLATVGSWTLGTSGAQVLTASVGDLTVQFTATITSGNIFGAGYVEGGFATLYTIDRATGAATLVDTLRGSAGRYRQVGAMDFHPTTGVLYGFAIRPDDFASVLVTIDPATAFVTDVGPTGVSAMVQDASFRSDGQLYISAGPRFDRRMYHVNISTGAAAEITQGALSNGGGNGLAFDASDVLLHSDDAQTNAVSTVDGFHTKLADLLQVFDCDGASRSAATDLDRLTGQMLAVIKCPSGTHLGRLNHATGEVTLIGLTENIMDALAVRNAPGSEPAPAPATLSTVGTMSAPAGSEGSADNYLLLTSGAGAPMPGVKLRLEYNGPPEDPAFAIYLHTDSEGRVTQPRILAELDGFNQTATTWPLDAFADYDAINIGNAPYRVDIVITAGEATDITIVEGNGQFAEPGTAVATAPAVKVVDGFGNGVPGVSITFSVNSGGGSVTGGSTVTDADGVARVGSWTLGTDGAQQLLATDGNELAVVFDAAFSSRVLGSAHISGGAASLYYINPASGAATLIGPIGFDRVGAMDFHPVTGVLYAVGARAGDGPGVLLTIDPATGAGTEVGPTGIEAFVSDISFRSDGTLFAYEPVQTQTEPPYTGNQHHLYTINLTTGAATKIGPTGISGGGNAIAFNANDVLHHAPSQGSNFLSPATGASWNNGSMAFLDLCGGGRLAAADLDRQTGQIFGTVICGSGETATAHLATVDFSGLAVTAVGTTAPGMDGMAIRNAPGSEPQPTATATLALNPPVEGPIDVPLGEDPSEGPAVRLTTTGGAPIIGSELIFEAISPIGYTQFRLTTNEEGEVPMSAVGFWLGGHTDEPGLINIWVRGDVSGQVIGNAPFAYQLNATANSIPLTASPLTTQLNAAFGTPTIDGQISQGEWTSAECGSVVVDLPQGGTGSGVVCARNDNTNLYMLFQLNGDNSGYLTRSFNVELDEHDDGFGPGDDSFSANAYTDSYFDQVRAASCDPSCLVHDADNGGQTHGSFSYGFHGNHHVFEVSKPLAADDQLDMHRVPGTSIFILPSFDLENADTTTNSLFNAGAGGIRLHLAGSDPIPPPQIQHASSEQWTYVFTGGITFISIPMERHDISITNAASFPSWMLAPNPDVNDCPLRIYIDVIVNDEVMGGACDSSIDLNAVPISSYRWDPFTAPVTVRVVDQYTNRAYVSDPMWIYGPQFTHTPREFSMDWSPVEGAILYNVEVEYGEECTLDGDWRVCSSWQPEVTYSELSPATTSQLHTFEGARPGRWRVIAHDGLGPISTGEWKYFRFRN